MSGPTSAPASPLVSRIEPMAPESPFTGFRTLLYKETLRFWKVSFQTVGAPVLNALLFLLIFSHVLDRHVTVYGDVAYTSFLVPGLVMMSVLQNAFANSSSSLIQSKITGNIIFVLLPPLSYREFYAAYVIASTLRGLMVGAGVLAVSAAFVEVPMANPARGVELGGTVAEAGEAGEGGWVDFGFDSYADVETLLARLREAGAGMTEMQLGEPDLERVFVEVMHRA